MNAHLDPLRNPLDPLRKANPKQLELFRQLARLCVGFSIDEVIGASINVLINSVRQTYVSRAEAEAAWDMHFGKSKQLLLEHYDSVTGRRRSVFPHHQVVHMPRLVDKDKS